MITESAVVAIGGLIAVIALLSLTIVKFKCPRAAVALVGADLVP